MLTAKPLRSNEGNHCKLALRVSPWAPEERHGADRPGVLNHPAFPREKLPLARAWEVCRRLARAMFVLTAAAGLLITASRGQEILVKPYVQPGDGSILGATDVKVIAWMTDQVSGEFVLVNIPKNGRQIFSKMEKANIWDLFQIR